MTNADMIKKQIEKMEKEMNIAGMLAEINKSAGKLYGKLRHKYKEIKKLEQELLKSAKKQNLPEIERMLIKKKAEFEKEADEISQEIKKLHDRRQEVIKQQSL
jgi:phage shock protein A